MAHQTLTLTIPDDLYQRIKQQANISRRNVEDELLRLATSALMEDEIPADILEAVAALGQCTDDALWQTARTSKLSPKQSGEIERLHFKQPREGLTLAEQEQLARLMHHYRKALLVWAHAVGLLKDRGHDVNVLLEEA